MMLDFNHAAWRPPVTKVVATENQGVEELLDNIYSHVDYMDSSGLHIERRINNAEAEIIQLTQQKLMQGLLGNDEKRTQIRCYAKMAANREKDPYAISNELLNKMLLGRRSDEGA
jgi:LAO/AO transport system kinase